MNVALVGIYLNIIILNSIEMIRTFAVLRSIINIPTLVYTNLYYFYNLY